MSGASKRSPVLDEPLATTEIATAEACHRLRNLRPALLELMVMIAEGRVVLQPVLSEHPRRVGELLAKYPRMDVGDATLVVLPELCPRAKLITVDNDFPALSPLPSSGDSAGDSSSGVVAVRFDINFRSLTPA